MGNPYSHLLSCVAAGDESQLHRLFLAATNSSNTVDDPGSMTSYISSSLSASEREKIMYKYIDVIISLNLPLSIVDNSKFRSFVDSTVIVSSKAVRETLFKLVELVELAIQNDMKGTRGAIMHDG